MSSYFRYSQRKKNQKKERLTFPLESDQGEVSKNQVGPRHRTQLVGYLLFRRDFCRKFVKKSIRETTAKVLAAPQCGGFQNIKISRNGRYYDRYHRTDGTVRAYGTYGTTVIRDVPYVPSVTTGRLTVPMQKSSYKN